MPCGGKALSDTCYAPTVILDPPDDQDVSRKEIFGPVVCVYPHRDKADAIARANALPYAFQASVYTRDLDDALDTSRKLDATAVVINDHTAFRVDWMRDMTREKMLVIKSDVP